MSLWSYKKFVKSKKYYKILLLKKFRKFHNSKFFFRIGRWKLSSVMDNEGVYTDFSPMERKPASQFCTIKCLLNICDVTVVVDHTRYYFEFSGGGLTHSHNFKTVKNLI